MKQKLAINGGTPAKTTPYSGGLRYTGNEAKYLQEALAANTLFYGYGRFVPRACDLMRTYTGRPHVVACSSGSAAVHLGLVAAGIGPGDEVVVTPNTDIGSVSGIIGEGAIPVFCDCEWNLQPSAATIAAALTPRTRAVVVVHLAGYPAPIDEIMELCTGRGVAVVEDCAQSWGTRLHGRLVGTSGVAGCYSTNEFKHISSGDGGFVALSDPELYRRVSNYADKHYDRLFDRSLDKAHFGMNYRMTELQGAVACAQLEVVDRVTDRYHALGERLSARLAGMRGGHLVTSVPGAHVTYWFTVLICDEAALTVKRNEIVAALAAEGVAASSYRKYDLIGSGLFQTLQVRPWLEVPRNAWPLAGQQYNLTQTPTHSKLLACGIMVSISQFYSDHDIDESAAGIRKVFAHYAK